MTSINNRLERNSFVTANQHRPLEWDSGLTIRLTDWTSQLIIAVKGTCRSFDVLWGNTGRKKRMIQTKRSCTAISHHRDRTHVSRDGSASSACLCTRHHSSNSPRGAMLIQMIECLPLCLPGELLPTNITTPTRPRLPVFLCHLGSSRWGAAVYLRKVQIITNSSLRRYFVVMVGRSAGLSWHHREDAPMRHMRGKLLRKAD